MMKINPIVLPVKIIKRFICKKIQVNRENLPDPLPPRRPEDNEIPGSSNILSSEGAAADIISPTSTKSESSRQQLNLGELKKIASSIFFLIVNMPPSIFLHNRLKHVQNKNLVFNQFIQMSY